MKLKATMPLFILLAGYNCHVHANGSQWFGVDILETSYDQNGIQCAQTVGDDQLEMWVYSGISYQTYIFMQGMEGYAEEMDEWYANIQFNQVKDYTESLNSDLTDDVAYAVVKESLISLDSNGDGIADTYHNHEDIVWGNDWDNNGKLDVLEASSNPFSYVGVVIRLR